MNNDCYERGFNMDGRLIAMAQGKGRAIYLYDNKIVINEVINKSIKIKNVIEIRTCKRLQKNQCIIYYLENKSRKEVIIDINKNNIIPFLKLEKEFEIIKFQISEDITEETKNNPKYNIK